MGTVDVTITQGAQSDTLAGAFEYTVPFTTPSLAGVTYDSLSGSLSAQIANPGDICINPSTTVVFAVGANTDKVYEYAVSNADDISTLSYSGNSYSVLAQEGIPGAICFNDDGLKMYVTGTMSDAINQYALSVPYSLSGTVTFEGAASVADNPVGMFFKPDGTKVYILNLDNSIREYDLTTAWDVTAGLTLIATAGSVLSRPTGMDISRNGDRVYVCSSNDIVESYDMSVDWDLSTMSTTKSGTFNFGSEEGFGTGVRFRNDGLKMYICGSNTDAIYQYST